MDQVNPDMILKKGKAMPEAIIEEKANAVMPQVGTMPTGKKAAKKHTIGM